MYTNIRLSVYIVATQLSYNKYFTSCSICYLYVHCRYTSNGIMTCSRIFLVLIVLLMLMCCALLIALGILYVRPYVKTSAYSPAKCRAVNVTDHGLMACDCSSDDEDECHSVFPCVEITVKIIPNTLTETHKSRLFLYYTSDYITEKVNC